MDLKTKLVFISLFLIITSRASSAGVIREIGFEVGPNLGYLDYDDPMEIWDPGWGVGITGGVRIEVSIAAHLSFVPEIRYSHLKNKVEIIHTDIKGNFGIEHNSISFPLLLRYEFMENTFSLDMGPEFALMFSSKSHNDYHDLMDEYHGETQDISDKIIGYNVLACARLCFNAHRWDIPLSVSVAYHHGFAGVAEDDDWWSDWKTRELSMCLSYVYRFE